MDGFNYSLILRKYNNDWSHDPIKDDDYEYLIEQLEDCGEVLTAEQKEDSTFIKGVFDSLKSVVVLEDYFLNYEYYLTISDYTSDALVGVAELTTRPKDGYEYSLSLCRFLELPNGTAIHLPIDEDDHDLFEETLEDLGDLRIAEKREDYSFFKGSLDSLEYVGVLEDKFDIYKYDLTISNYD